MQSSIGGNAEVATWFLATFKIGGSLITNFSLDLENIGWSIVIIEPISSTLFTPGIQDIPYIPTSFGVHIPSLQSTKEAIVSTLPH